MPKMKTHRASAKRFRVTGSGKIVRRKAFRKHLLVHKSASRIRRISGKAEISDADLARIDHALPYKQYLR